MSLGEKIPGGQLLPTYRAYGL